MQPPDSYTATFEQQQQAKQSNVMRGLNVVAPTCGPQKRMERRCGRMLLAMTHQFVLIT